MNNESHPSISFETMQESLSSASIALQNKELAISRRSKSVNSERRGTNEEKGQHNVTADDRRLFVHMNFRFAESGPPIDELHYTSGISVIPGVSF